MSQVEYNVTETFNGEPHSVIIRVDGQVVMRLGETRWDADTYLLELGDGRVINITTGATCDESWVEIEWEKYGLRLPDLQDKP